MSTLFILLVVLILFILCFMCFDYHRYRIKKIDNTNYEHYKKKLAQFEHNIGNWYAYGNDRFKINHGSLRESLIGTQTTGEDYYKFFERIGKMTYFFAIDMNDDIIATACSVMRTNTRINYVCDIKIDPSYRGGWLLQRMYLYATIYVYMPLRRNIEEKNKNKFYGISMNNTKNKENYMVKIAKKIVGDSSLAGNLLIYTVDSSSMEKCVEILKKHKGELYYRTLKGIKDLILESNNKPLKILHVNFTKNDQYSNKSDNDTVTNKILENYKYMFCFHEKDPIVAELAENNITTDATASIVHYRLNHYQPTDWDFIQTSDI